MVEQPENERDETLLQKFSAPICAPEFITLSDNPGIKFTIDLNDTIRDDYEPIERNPVAGEQIRPSVNIQGDKTKLEGTKTRKSVLPKVNVSVYNE